ncbi:MAG: NF041680 family putative transposase [Cyanobacteria bacterium J06638_22]
MPVINTESELYQFRNAIYNQFTHRADSAMDLLDALCSNQSARSVVELSLNPLFRRGHHSVFKAIDAALAAADKIEGHQPTIAVISTVIPSPEKQPYRLFCIDCSSLERVYAHTLEDRSMVHRPTAVNGQTPVTIGHSYSMGAILPERDEQDARWTIPLDIKRVPTDKRALQIGVEQVEAIMDSEGGNWHESLSVLVVDSAYGVKGFLQPIQQHTSLVTVARSRSNRVFYQSPPPSDTKTKGHPRWYGARFALNDPDTWHPADVSIEITEPGKQGPIHVHLQSWSNMLMRGAKAHPMHQHPFTLIRVERRNAQGQRIGQVMWLIVIGHCRVQICLLQAYRAYRQRFDIEHTFRFLKRNLLLNAFQTPEVEHEQDWLRLVMLAYVQLWVAQPISVAMPKPWESSHKRQPDSRIPPSKVQQDWNRIIRLVGTPAADAKPRGISPGRQPGQSQTRRPRQPVIKKSQSRAAQQKKAA